jgi:pseudoazurin
MKPWVAIPSALAAIAIPLSVAQARTITVLMKNQGAEGAMVFEPSLIHANVGDTIRFKPADPGHNAETIPAMLPPGATAIKGAMGKAVVMTPIKPGLYGIRCLPHFAMGMIALVQVGKPKPVDIAAAKAALLPAFAAKRMTALLAKVQ